MPSLKWTKEFCESINDLIKKGMSYPEISAQTGIEINSLKCGMQKRGYKNSVHLKRMTKHKHLRRPVFEYFQNHSIAETSIKFGLTETELKSIFTVGYKMSDLKHLRKDTRRRDKWTAEEIRTMIKWSGILPRAEIAKIINRDNERVIKEKLSHLGVSSRNLNGMNINQFRMTFGDIPVCSVRTRAGPPSRNYFTQVLWVDLEEMIKRKEVRPSKALIGVVSMMAKFQRWVWGNENIHEEISKKLKEENKYV